jgi:hypothetical protein
MAIMTVFGCERASIDDAELGWDSPACERDSGDELSMEIDVGEDEVPPCAVVIRSTGISLEVSIADEVDAKLPIGRTRTGEYLAPSFSGVLNRWSAQGQFVESVGQRGPGPYAYRRASGVYLDGHDTIHVADPPGRWHVLEPGGRQVRTIRGPSLARKESMAFLDDNRILVALPNPGFYDTGYRYFILDRSDGSVLSRFDRATTSDVLREARFVAYRGGDRFWAMSPSRYSLELWTTEGQRLGVVRREAQWFENHGEGLRAETGPAIVYLHVDPHDVLWVVTRIPKFEGVLDELEPEMIKDAFAVHVEAFDANSGALLASERFDDPLAFPAGFFGNGNAYRIEYRDDGLIDVEIVELRLVSARSTR